MIENKEKEIIIADTIEFSDSELKDDETFELIKSKVYSSMSILNLVIVAISSDRLQNGNIKYIKLIMEWLDNHPNFIFLITNCENKTIDEKVVLKFQLLNLLNLKSAKIYCVSLSKPEILHQNYQEEIQKTVDIIKDHINLFDKSKPIYIPNKY